MCNTFLTTFAHTRRCEWTNSRRYVWHTRRVIVLVLSLTWLPVFCFRIFHVFLCVLDYFILPSCSICIRMTSNPFWSRLFWMAAWMRVLTEWSRYSNCHAHQLVMHTTTHDRLCTHGTIKCGNLQWLSLANRVSG